MCRQVLNPVCKSYLPVSDRFTHSGSHFLHTVDSTMKIDVEVAMSVHEHLLLLLGYCNAIDSLIGSSSKLLHVHVSQYITSVSTLDIIRYFLVPLLLYVNEISITLQAYE